MAVHPDLAAGISISLRIYQVLHRRGSELAEHVEAYRMPTCMRRRRRQNQYDVSLDSKDRDGGLDMNERDTKVLRSLGHDREVQETSIEAYEAGELSDMTFGPVMRGRPRLSGSDELKSITVKVPASRIAALRSRATARAYHSPSGFVRPSTRSSLPQYSDMKDMSSICAEGLTGLYLYLHLCVYCACPCGMAGMRPT